MKNIWLKIIKSWSWIIIGFVILVILLWPILNSRGDYENKNSRPVVKILNQENKLLLSASSTTSTTENLSENILIFGGDIMLSRTVNARMVKYNDYTWPFKSIYPLFKKTDLSIANLESPFLITDNYDVPSGSFAFKADPRSVAGLSLAGFDVLSLANNHILNQGATGLKDTRNILDQAGIDYVGVTDHNLVVKESHGLKFAFLSYTYAPESKLIAFLPDAGQLAADISHARKQADVVIVMMHAGTEYQRQPNKQQLDFAHLAIDSGADLVVGAHPHWPQTVEQYQGKTIIYSLGNLVFDQMWSKETSVGLLAEVHFKGKKLERINYIPIDIKDYGKAEIMPAGKYHDLLLESIGVK